MICTSIAYKSFEECREILSGEMCAELRLDLLDLTREQVSDLFSLPVKIVATCREGHYSVEERRIMLETAIKSGASYVDIEMEMPRTLRKNLVTLAGLHQCRVIVSYHNHTSTPGLKELKKIVGECRKSGADIVKIACKVNGQDDLAKLLALYVYGNDIIAIGMGEEGFITRLAAPLLGAEFTYASADRNSNTAPGQMTSNEMRKLYEQLGINF